MTRDMTRKLNITKRANGEALGAVVSAKTQNPGRYRHRTDVRQKVSNKRGAVRGTTERLFNGNGPVPERAQVQPTVCEVRRVERQSAAQVLINPPAGSEEVFTLRTERTRFIKDDVIENSDTSCDHSFKPLSLFF